jgi:chromosome segregation ATPase
MKTITEALAESNGRCTALEGTITELKEGSARKEKALVEQTEVATSAENDMETQKKKVVVLTMELEKLRKTHECAAIDSRRALAEQRATHEQEYSAARVQWETEMEAMKQELTEKSEELLQTQTLLRTSEASLAESRAAMEQLSAIEQGLRAEGPELTRQLQEVQGLLSENKLEQRIESKKRNRLVQELKAQLKKDALRVHTIITLLQHFCNTFVTLL